MATISRDIRLEQNFDAHGVDISALLRTWDGLQKYTVEATTSGRPALFDFASEHCLCSAAIQYTFKEAYKAEEVEEEGSFQQTHVQENYSIPARDLNTRGLSDFPDLHRERSKQAGITDHGTADERPTYITRTVTAGFIYLTSTHMLGEVALGVGIHPDWQGKGVAAEAIDLMLHWVFDEFGCHRVQASIMDSPARWRALQLFNRAGFRHEGTHRRVVLDPDGAWTDVTRMGLLDTEWVMRAPDMGPPMSLWDELLARHQREREELLRWEESQRRLNRSSSQETLRFVPESEIDPDSAAPTDTEDQTDASAAPSVFSSARTSPDPVPRDIFAEAHELSVPAPNILAPFHSIEEMPASNPFQDRADDSDADDSSEFSYLSIPTRSRSQSVASLRSWSSAEVSSVASSAMHSISDDEDL